MHGRMIELQVVDVMSKFDEEPSLVIKQTSRLSAVCCLGTTS
jgi:hypothetical protein